MLKDFKAPDVKGKRYRPGTYNILNKAFYALVRNSHPSLAALSDQTIKSLVHTANAVVQEKVIENRDGVELPEQLGFLFLGSVPPTKNRNVDYKTSIRLGKLVHHQNWDTDNLTGKIFYTNYPAKYRFKFRELWQFTAVRQFKKVASKAFLEDHSRYTRTDNLKKISSLFKRTMYSRKAGAAVQ